MLDLSHLAKRHLADYDAHRPGRIFADGADFLDVAQAYALQREVARLRIARGEALAGYKVGCVSEAIQRQFGLDRIVFGHIFSTEVHPNGIALDPRQFDGLAVEGEFAFRLAAEIPDAAWLRGRRERALAAFFPVIELHNYVFHSDPPTGQELIANNGLHAGVVLPPRESPVESLDQSLNEEIAVLRNGQLLGRSSGRGLPDGPFASLVQLVEHLGNLGICLHRGQIVLTGSPLPLYRVSPGDYLEVECTRLGKVEASVKSGAL